jgi:GlcNAc-PI de-N-acetylase
MLCWLVLAYVQLEKQRKLQAKLQSQAQVQQLGQVPSDSESSILPQIGLVIAHPDDEAMFFVPTLLSVPPYSIHVLCLSNGNFDGLGKQRELELKQALQTFGVSAAIQCEIVSHPQLQDSPTAEWPHDLIRQITTKFAQQRQLDKVSYQHVPSSPLPSQSI